MKFNPAFLNIKTGVSLDGKFSADWEMSKEFEMSNVVQLPLVPNEVYSQFIVLKNEQVSSSINLVQLCTESGRIIDDYFEYGFIAYPEFDCIYFSFKLLKEYTGCLRFKFHFNLGNSALKEAYSSKFTCNNGNKDFTNLVTYRNVENIYSIPYEENSDPVLWQQIRLPIWYKNSKTEQDSEESVYDTNEFTNINISRVERRFLKVWRVVASDFINERLSIITDSSHVYIAGQREICRPFVYEELTAGAVSSSLLETQTVFGDEFIDKTGYLGAPIRINEVLGGCCNEDGKGRDPFIDSDTEVASGCDGNGLGWEIEVVGEPYSIAKARITATNIQGQTKNLLVISGNNIQNFSFTNAEGGEYDYYFELDGNGYAMIQFKSCFEDCLGSNLIDASFKFELYDLMMNEITNQIVNFGKQVQCTPVGYVPELIVTNDLLESLKELKITGGEPNGVAHLRITVWSATGVPEPPNNVFFGGYLNENNVEELDEWFIDVPLDSNGEATGLMFGCTKAGQWEGTTPPKIQCSVRAFDYNMQPTYSIIAIQDV